ncbi:MAG: DNA gyrase subunit A, partial [Lentisphaeria bacterium]|nr:DNA gyrase subunit A [Lentisphaeria bacterium]
VIAALQIVNSDELLMTTAEGQLVRIPASEIRTIGRNSVGVRIMNLKENDRITGVAKLVEVEAEKKEESAEGTIPAGIVSAGVPAPAAPEVTEDGSADDGDGE